MIRGEVTAFVADLVQALDAKLLEEDNRATAITYVSVCIQRKYPQIPRESRRAIAARHLHGERKRRKNK